MSTATIATILLLGGSGGLISRGRGGGLAAAPTRKNVGAE